MQSHDNAAEPREGLAPAAEATPSDEQITGAAMTASPRQPDYAQAEARAAEAELRRVQAIRELAREHALGHEWADRHVDARTSVSEAKRFAADIVEFQTRNAPVAPTVEGGTDRNLETIGAAFRDALIMRAGGRVENPHERAREFLGGNTLSSVGRFFGALGVKTDTMTPAQLASLALDRGARARMLSAVGMSAATAPHSTADFDEVLRDAVNKRLRDAYVEYAPTWSVWCRENATVPDFKTIRATQLSAAPTPPLVAEGAEFQHATIADGEETYALAKYGQIISLTWEALINDDLAAFNRLPAMQGVAAARLEDDLVYGILTANANMADGNALFSAAHGNIETSGGAPSVTTLGAGRAAMRSQTGLSGEKLNISPSYLIVPAALETIADQLVNSTVDPALANATPNPFSGRLTTVVNSRLDDSSTAGWYLAASPMMIDTIEVAFLAGYRQPQVEEEMSFFTDARNYKVRHTVAAKALDWRGLYYNDGVT